MCNYKNGGSDEGVKGVRIGKFNRIWNDHENEKTSTLKKTLIFPIVVNGVRSETWTINESTKRGIEHFEMEGYRKILILKKLHSSSRKVNLTH